MGYPMYVLVTEEEYRQAQENCIDPANLFPDDSSLSVEPDFEYWVGRNGYISSRDVNVSEKDQAEAAQRLANFYGNDICHVEKNILVFEPDASQRYAKKKINLIKNLVTDMTPEEYLDLGEDNLRAAIQTRDALVHTYSEFDEAEDEFTQSADRFVIETLKHWESRRFIVTATLCCHE